MDRFIKPTTGLSFRNGRDLAQRLMHPSWFAALEAEFDKAYFGQLMTFLHEQSQQATIYPPIDKIYSWAALPISDVHVVIIGQDPYHGPGQAHGLSFSVLPGVPAPPSLMNMYAELESDISRCPAYEGKAGINGHSYRSVHGGTLTGWAEQGVLLLNAVLTVERGKAASHAGKGWEQFTDAVLHAVVKARATPPVYVLWGVHAQKKFKNLGLKAEMAIQSAHPSPLSARRGFLGSKPYSRINEMLTQQGQPTIDWTQVSNKWLH